MIIITGASRNIGKFLFNAFSSKEITVGTYLSTKPDFETTDNLFQVDVSSYESVLNFYEQIEENLNNITLINCAGISYNAFTHKSEPEQWKKVIETNLLGSYHMIRVLLPIMRTQKYGRIINFSSVVAQKGTPGVSAYAASKSALWGLSKSIAQENGSLGITINNINLGYVNMGMGVEQVPEKYQDIIKQQIPSNDFCNPEDIIKAVEFLRNNSYINGSSIDLSGGLI
ncbi:3-oxoacyl-[acyl-carrier-protein] reductase [Paludibacter sp.]